jgi:DsbC/DsbD-like thiol-disulfide interchange protein
MRPIRPLMLAPLLAAALCAGPAGAFDLSAVLEAEIRPGWRTAEGTHMAALHLRLADGWKTYWRAPGEAGIPPRFDWSGSRNVTEVRLHWPRPIVFETLGQRSIGYAGELVLPVELTLRDGGQPVEVAVRVDLGVCETICVPATVILAGRLGAGGSPDPRIEAALAARPHQARAAGLTGVACAVDPIADGLRVTARLDLPPLGSKEVAVFELSDATIWISEADSRREGGRLTAAAEMVAPSGAPFALDRSDLRITVLGEGRAAELRGCPAG